MTLRRPLSAVLLSLALLASAACSDDDSGSTSTTAADAAEEAGVLAAMADEVIVPAYEGLDTALADLGTAIDRLCATPSPATLDEAQEAWRTASTAWQRARAGTVGPAMERRLMASVAYDARPNLIEERLASGDPVDPDSLSEEGTAVRGLRTVERLLFVHADELVTPAGARACEYASSATTLAAEAAATVLTDWTTDGCRDTFVDGIDGSPQSTVEAVVNETAFRLQELDERGLRPLTLVDAAEDLRAQDGDGPAAYSLAEQRALLDGLEPVLVGTDGEGGIAALVAAQDQDAADRLRTSTGAAVQAMAGLPDSVADAFEDPAAIHAAADAVADLRVLVTTEVASQLGVTIGFSDADGDS